MLLRSGKSTKSKRARLQAEPASAPRDAWGQLLPAPLLRLALMFTSSSRDWNAAARVSKSWQASFADEMTARKAFCSEFDPEDGLLDAVRALPRWEQRLQRRRRIEQNLMRGEVTLSLQDLGSELSFDNYTDRLVSCYPLGGYLHFKQGRVLQLDSFGKQVNVWQLPERLLRCDAVHFVDAKATVFIAFREGEAVQIVDSQHKRVADVQVERLMRIQAFDVDKDLLCVSVRLPSHGKCMRCTRSRPAFQSACLEKSSCA
jgi:hypothetical protein